MNNIEKLLLSMTSDCNMYLDYSSIGFFSEENEVFFIFTKNNDSVCFLDIVNINYTLLKNIDIPIVYVSDFLLQTTGHTIEKPHCLLTDNKPYHTCQSEYTQLTNTITDCMEWLNSKPTINNCAVKKHTY